MRVFTICNFPIGNFPISPNCSRIRAIRVSRVRVWARAEGLKG